MRGKQAGQALAVFLLAAVALGAMDDTMLLVAKGGEATVVTFEHKTHTIDRAIACTVCHHNMAEAGTPPCVDCHELARGEAAREAGSPRPLEDAYHDICLGCHKEPPKGTSPPTECEQCHLSATPEPATEADAP